ncbi:MAG: phosphotransferase [Candidatus Poribacteria bacterium]|nr:phosphotransferase [Candidatus Poribacteria bacterium]
MEHLIEHITAHFKTDADALKFEPIQHGTRQRRNVCILKFDTEKYLLKQYDMTTPVVDAGHTPLQIEAAVLTLLHDKGCQVPQLIWKSERLHSLLLEWCGEFTLDALVQSHKKPAQSITALLYTILRELCKIENCFTTHAAQFAPYVFRFNAQTILRDLLEQGKKVVGYLSHLNNSRMSSAEIERFTDTWNMFANRLQHAPTTLGNLDNNARNIVIRDVSPFFIDFASIGWNWQAMRLVQLFNSIGAFLVPPLETGNFVSLLDRELVNTYAEWVSTHRETCPPAEVAARVDGHHLLFYLSVIHQLLQATAQPEAAESRILLEAWGNAQARFQSALTHVTDIHLSDDICTNRIRELIGGFSA